jgi:hypothetical protein
VLVVVLWCIRLYIGGGGGVVVRDLRSGDDGDHLGGARNQEGDQRLGNSNPPVRRSDL